MTTDYLAPVAEARAELREKGSRFLGMIVPAVDEAQAGEVLDRVRKQYPDATHHCWAWRLGSPARERASDDGEPSGTAGAPMLRVLAGRGLSDVVAVVVRWYGGTKLGKGGLARAYGGSVREALELARLEVRFSTLLLHLDFPYDRVGAVKRLVQPPLVEIESETYEERVRMILRVASSVREKLEEDLAEIGVAAGHR